VEPLTRREREVALLAAGGATSKEIAERLSVSKRTVDTHLDRIYRKLGVTGRDELTGALDPESPT
jgi:DNA-binding CsgD family transcriptional regulator